METLNSEETVSQLMTRLYRMRHALTLETEEGPGPDREGEIEYWLGRIDRLKASLASEYYNT